MNIADEESTTGDPKKKAFVTPLIVESPRGRRISQRQAKMATNGFKIPLKASDPELTDQAKEPSQNFKIPPVLAKDATSPRVTRPTRTFKKPESLHPPDTKGSADNAVVEETAQPKLNYRNVSSAIPSSSMTASSRRSTSNDRASTLSSPISSPPSSPELDALIEKIPLLVSKAAVFYHPAITAKCPYCKERIDRDFLPDFDKTVRLSVGAQIRFCKAHRIRSGEAEWKEKGYPVIDWPGFDKRLTKFHVHLDDILENKRESFYRNAYEERLKNRQNETAEQSVEDLELGYYGSKGAESM